MKVVNEPSERVSQRQMERPFSNTPQPLPHNLATALTLFVSLRISFAFLSMRIHIDTIRFQRKIVCVLFSIKYKIFTFLLPLAQIQIKTRRWKDYTSQPQYTYSTHSSPQIPLKTTPITCEVNSVLFQFVIYPNIILSSSNFGIFQRIPEIVITCWYVMCLD